MTDQASDKETSLFSVKDPVLRLAVFTCIGLLVALFIARAPTAYNGKLPVIGDYVPLTLNAVYFIILGPMVGTVMAAYIWHLCRREKPEAPIRISRNTGVYGFLFAVFVGLSVALSLQYFLILAPKELCATIPHYDFLWTNHPGPVQIAHCFSGTQQINSQAPYYLEPQILQSWGHVFWPLLTAVFLRRAWSLLRSRMVVTGVVA